MTILIITHSKDNQSIARVMDGITQLGERAFRLNTDGFPTEILLDIYCDGRRQGFANRAGQRVVLSDGENHLDLDEVKSVWYRRIGIGNKIPTTMDMQLRNASIQESRATILGMIASINGFHLDQLVNIRRAEHKQLQLQVAQKFGLEIPLTLTTNNPQAVQEFAKNCPHGMITKMLSSFAIYDEEGKEKVVFTNPVTAKDLESLEGLKFCPMTFQENVPKALELRTTIVGKKIFTAAVDSQKIQQATHDWRKKGIALIKDWQPYQLPEDMEVKLLKFMQYFGLNYGAIDIILTPDGKYVFLEINPVGEFFWLENSAGCEISQAIAQLLVLNHVD